MAYSIADYFMNTTQLDLSDLIEQTVQMGHKKLNLMLSSIPYTEIELHPTKLFTNFGDDVLGLASSSLNELVGNLSDMYGNEAITTEINQVRAYYLATSNHTVYAESEFSVALDGDFSFSTQLGDGEGTVGFLPSTSLTARIVTIHEDHEVNALPAQPLFLVQQRRGFILPTSVEDISKMAPGESITLLGQGQVGFNIGANLPIYSFEPVSYLTLNTRFHLGGRVLTEGKLDVHLVRGQADEVIIEIGIADIHAREVRVGLKSGYGLVDIPAVLEVDVAGQVWSLGELAEGLIERRLDQSGLLSYGAKALSENTKSHITLERFRLHLNQRSKHLDQALLQALTGDLRLLQALSDRDQGVHQEVSFERNMNEEHRYRGTHVTSMRLFSERNIIDGSIRIEDENGIQELLFEDLQESRGKFFRDWGFRRLIMTSSRWKGATYLGSKANLRLAVTESDHFTARDQILDHVDTALLSFIDFDVAYTQLTRLYEVLEQKVDLNCEYCDEMKCIAEYESCMDMTLSDEEIEGWYGELEHQTNQIMRQINTTTDNPDLHTALQYTEALLALKLKLSSVKEIDVTLADVAGHTEVLSDVRFGQSGLDSLFRDVTRDQFKEKLNQMLVVVVSKRSRNYEQKFGQAMKWVDRESEKIQDIVDIYDAARTQYIRLDEQSRIHVAGRDIGNGAHLVQALSNTDKTPVVRSIAESKAKVVAEMIDQMVERGEEISVIQSLIYIFSLGFIDPLAFESHHLITYTLTALVDPASREWLLSMNFEKDIVPDIQLFSRGADDDSFIQAGQFGLDFLLDQ